MERGTRSRLCARHGEAMERSGAKPAALHFTGSIFYRFRSIFRYIELSSRRLIISICFSRFWPISAEKLPARIVEGQSSNFTSDLEFPTPRIDGCELLQRFAVAENVSGNPSWEGVGNVMNFLHYISCLGFNLNLEVV